MTDSDNNNDDEEGDLMSDSNFLIFVWVVAFAVFICAPLCYNRDKRRLWWRRITTCNWRVEPPPPERDPEWFQTALERYHENRLRAETEARRLAANAHRLSNDQAHEVRQIYLLEQMGNYTTTLHDTDIHEKRDGAGNEETKEEEETQQTDSKPQEEESNEHPLDLETGLDGNDNDMTPAIHDSDTYVCIRAGGVSLSDSNNESTATRPNGCAICLGEFEAGDRLTWASNQACPHVYHEDCILNWMLSVGSKPRAPNENEHAAVMLDPVQAALDFPKLCPCCRRPFICSKEEDGIRKAAAQAEAENESDGPRTTNASAPQEEPAAATLEA